MKSLREAEGLPVQAHEPMATTILALSLMCWAFLAWVGEEMAPSIKATSRFSRRLLVLRALTWRNSTNFFQESRFWLRSSVKSMVESSQQVNENQPMTSFLGGVGGGWSIKLV